MKKKSLIILMLLSISRIIGFLREITLSYFYGISITADAYLMSVSIVNTLFVAFFGAVATGLIPIYIKIEEEEGSINANKLVSNVINISVVISIVMITLVYLTDGLLVKVFAPGYNQEQQSITNNFLKIITIGIVFTAISNILQSYLKIKERYIIANFIPTINNYTIIVFTIISSYTKEYFLGIGVVFGYFLQSMLSFILAKKLNNQFRLRLSYDDNTRDLFKLVFPILISNSILFINNMIDTMIASNLPQGAVSAISYAAIISGTILGIMTAISGTLFLPNISKILQGNRYGEAIILFKRLITYFSLILIPTIFGLSFFSFEIIELVFGRGKFDSVAIIMTSNVLTMLSPSILFSSFITLATNIFYAKHNTISSLKVGMSVILINASFSLLLTPYFGIRGLVFSTTLSLVIGSIIALSLIKKDLGVFNFTDILSNIIKILIGSVIMIILSKLLYGILILNFIKAVSLFITIIAAMVIYLLVINLGNIDEVNKTRKEVFNYFGPKS